MHKIMLCQHNFMNVAGVWRMESRDLPSAMQLNPLKIKRGVGLAQGPCQMFKLCWNWLSKRTECLWGHSTQHPWLRGKTVSIRKCLHLGNYILSETEDQASTFSHFTFVMCSELLIGIHSSLRCDTSGIHHLRYFILSLQHPCSLNTMISFKWNTLSKTIVFKEYLALSKKWRNLI